MRRRHRRVKLALIATMAIGAVGSIAVPGVYAIFKAEARNTQVTSMTGTLTMDMTVANGSACVSYNGSANANANTNCDALESYLPAAEMYPGSPVTTRVVIHNSGSVPAADLRLFMPGGCTTVATPDAPSPGGGDPCGSTGMQMYVQETDLSGNPTSCRFPSGTTTCGWSTLSTLAPRTSLALSLSLGAGPAAQQFRYFTVGLEEPPAAANNLQGEAAAFVLTWHLNS